MTRRQFISDVRATHRLLSGDALINNRVIDSEAMTCNLMLIKQQTDKRRLFQSPNIFTPIPCLEMEEAPLSECCEYTSECMISRSVEKLPKIAEGIFGLLIQGVMGLDNNKFYKETTARRYSNILKLNQKAIDLYFWIYNEYLYVSSSDIKKVNLVAFFEEEVPIKLLYPGEDCDCKDKPALDELCSNPLDREFKCPGYLLNSVKDMVSAKLLRTYFNIVQDNTSDNKDDQAANNRQK